MLVLVLRALWRRRQQGVLLFLLAAIAATGAAAAPVYIAGSIQALAAAAVPEASNDDRIVAVSAQHPLGGDLRTDLATFADQVVRELNLGDFTAVRGAQVRGSFGNETAMLSYREDVCRHIAITGACPTQPREVVIPEPLATHLGLAVGGTLALRLGTSPTPSPLSVVGVYRPTDSNESYWGRKGAERVGPAVVFTAPATFNALGQPTVGLSVDLEATAGALRERDPQLIALGLEQGAARLTTQGMSITSGLRSWADRIFDDQQLVYAGVAVGGGQLLLMCWFALFLAVSQTSHDRRGDVALLKMRGSRRRDIWRLVAGQSLVPLVAGGAIGVVLGPAIAQWQTEPIADPSVRRAVWLAVAIAAAFAVVGAAAAALIAERRMVAEPVASLGRGVAAVRRGWRASVIDGVIVVLAVAAAFQVRTGGSERGVGLLAPILLALAVGALAARLIPWLAGRAGSRALRAGHLGSGLVALHLARRPGTSRMLGLVVVVVAVACGTLVVWSGSDTARADRATLELGADRVVTVGAANASALLRAVRAADPTGRYAMAVVQRDVTVPVLAVDSSRLHAVAPMLAGYGLPEWSALAAALRPPAVAAALATSAAGGPATMDVTWRPAAGQSTAGATPVSVVATFTGSDATTTTEYGPLLAGRHTYTATQPACGEGCRLVSLALRSGSTGALPAPGASATIHSVSAADSGPVADTTAGLLADRTRWRADVARGAQLPRLTSAPDGLTLTITEQTFAAGSRLEARAFVLDAPTPLPVVAAGDVDLGGIADPRAPLLDPVALPLRVVAEGRVLPRIGKGLLVDLEYADRLAGATTVGARQVWLAADAPSTMGR